MGRISMGRAIGDAYDFTFGKYLSILGVVWLPLLVIAAGEIFVLLPMARAIPDFIQHAAQHPHDATLPPAWMRLNAYAQLLNLVMLLVMVWIRVGVTKAALGLPRGPHFAYFFVGMDELRVIGAYIVFIALFYGAFIAAFIVIGIVAALGAALAAGGVFSQIDMSALGPWAIGAAVMAGLVVLGAVIYVQARLAFLLVPVTVSETRFGLWRSWELSRGNFWRIVVIAIGTASPLVLMEIVLGLALYVPVIIAIVSLAHHHPELLHDHKLAPAVFMSAVFRRLLVMVPIAGVVGVALAPLFTGLSFSPAAFAYRSLMEKTGGSNSA